MQYTNYFKRKLKTQQQIGLWVGLADAYGTEIAANAGYDWLLIDGEHAPSDLRTTLSQLQSIAAYPSQAVVRPPNRQCITDQAVTRYWRTDLIDSYGRNCGAGRINGQSSPLSTRRNSWCGCYISTCDTLEQYPELLPDCS